MDKKTIAECLYILTEAFGEIALLLDDDTIELKKTWSKKIKPSPIVTDTKLQPETPVETISLDYVRQALDDKVKECGRQKVTALLGGRKIATLTQDELRSLLNDIASLTVEAA
jgi:hypothetical protein